KRSARRTVMLGRANRRWQNNSAECATSRTWRRVLLYWPWGIISTSAANGGNDVDKANQTQKTGDLDTKKIMELADRAQTGDTTAMPPLRRLMEKPEYVNALGGDLARRAQHTLIEKYAGKNLLAKESLHRKLELMTAELAGPNASPLERLIV